MCWSPGRNWKKRILLLKERNAAPEGGAYFCIVICLALIFSMSCTIAFAEDPVCTYCQSDSRSLGVSRTGKSSGNGVNVREHHRVPPAGVDERIFASALYGDSGSVSHAYPSAGSPTWYFVNFTSGNAKGHRGWVSATYVSMPEF